MRDKIAKAASPAKVLLISGLLGLGLFTATVANAARGHSVEPIGNHAGSKPSVSPSPTAKRVYVTDADIMQRMRLQATR